MRVKNKREKKKLGFLICMLLTLALGLGYAVLSEQLNLNGTVNYGTMAWDVGFTTAEDGGGSISSSPTVSADKKSVSITCNVGTSTSSETCIAKAKVKNSSTFAVKLESDPTITYDNTYISSVTSAWSENNVNIVGGDSLDALVEKEIKVTITTKELTEDMLPESNLSFPVNITLDWIEAGAGTTENIITISSIDDKAYENLSYRDIFLTNNKAANINFIDKANLSSLGSWEVNGTGTGATVDTTNYVTGPSSLRIDATSSYQFKNSSVIQKNHTYYYAAQVSIERHAAGYLGIGTGYPENYDKMAAALKSVTNGFVTVSNLYTHTSTSISFYIGSMSSANVTGNIDSVVFIDLSDLDIQNKPTKEQLDKLYDEFIKLYNGQTIRKSKDESLAFNEVTVDNSTARSTFYKALKAKTQALNMKYTTTFSNASGLSAGSGSVKIQDLVQLGVMAQNNETLSGIWGVTNYNITNLTDNTTQSLTSTVTAGTYSSNLSNYYDILGGKTGSTTVYNLVIAVKNKETGMTFVGAVSSDTADTDSSNRFSNAKILFDIASRLAADRSADISDLEQQLKSDRASVCIMPENPEYFLTHDLFTSEYHLYTKGKDSVFKYASTQKVLSILTALDYIDDLDKEIIITSSDIQSGSGPTITAGSKYTVRDALYAMMLPSSNTFAEVLARVAGKEIYLNNN